jgi:hypothetical protein
MSAESPTHAPAAAGASIPISGGRFRRACREMGLKAYLEQALLIGEHEFVSSDWATDPVQASAFVERVRSTWSGETVTVQIQYLKVGQNGESILLLTRPVDGLLLTLAAGAAMPVSKLRQIADELTGRLLNGGTGSKWAAWTEEAAAKRDSAYAIAWRPVEPLPQAMRQVIRQDVQRLARENGCQLSFVGVASDHVHLVLRCPSHRSSSWAAFAFKRGIEQAISHNSSSVTGLWRRGYLACPSTEPLAGEELLLYLGSSI